MTPEERRAAWVNGELAKAPTLTEKQLADLRRLLVLPRRRSA